MDQEYWARKGKIKDIHCRNTECKDGLHSFRNERPKKGETYRVDTCISCDIDIIDWNRLEKCDIKDIKFTVNSLQNEWIRNFYWYRPIGKKAIKWARKNDLDKIRDWAVTDLENKLAPYPNERLAPPNKKWIWRDGSQTQLHGNLVEYAKHATATCCRKCFQEWYGIQ